MRTGTSRSLRSTPIVARSITRLDDLVELRSVVIASHGREAARVADDASEDA